MDVLLASIREFINVNVSYPGLDRCLWRHGDANLKDLLPEEGEKKPILLTAHATQCLQASRYYT